MQPDPRTARTTVERCLRRELFGPQPDERPAGKPLEIGPDPLRFASWPEARGPWHEMGTGNEILDRTDPCHRYGVGVLFPSPLRSPLDQVEDVVTGETGLATGSGDEVIDVEAPSIQLESGSGGMSDAEGDDFDLQDANTRRQASIALSFRASLPAGSSLTLTARMGQYRRVSVQVATSKPREWWVRRPVEARACIAPGTVPRGRGEIELDDVSTEAFGDLRPRFVAFSRTLAAESDPQARLITVALLNDTQGTGPEACLFQAGFSVEASHGACILPYPDGATRGERDEEEQSLQLLYRNARTYAVGHGCAAGWDGGARGKVVQVRAEMLPAVEQPSLTSEINTSSGLLQVCMNDLAGDDPARAERDVRLLIDGYARWVAAQRERSRHLESEHRDAALRHLAACDDTLRRMRRGWELVQTDERAGTAFRLANRAMQMQQVRARTPDRETFIDRAGHVHVPDQPMDVASARRYWRPFQIAFLLAGIESIVVPGSDERELVDLIYFPTGGGKTEAYLGAAAISMLARRLRDPHDTGTDVIMRYTLRLLTAQQFLRASSLICALESIRRQRDDLGSRPFRIGIWLGSQTTPNKRAEAQKALRDLNEYGQSAENPFLLARCPWCGALMGSRPVDGTRRRAVRGYERTRHSVVLVCPDTTCEFSDSRGLPVLVVDEDIYQQRPELVIGTVDKFAMLAWRPEAAAIFGVKADGTRLASPPGLIIQDELHLISGPLGSMVGLYEAVIEALCTDAAASPTGPKIIASTATIRRYAEQIHSLYGRDRVSLFPPPALDANETYFAGIARDTEGRAKAGSRYIGVHGPSLGSIQTAQVRVAAALLQAPLSLPDEERDPYWTNLWFFNSLRELGNTVSLIESDIRDYLRGMQLREELREVRWPSRVIELTSRLRNDRVPKAIEQLSTAYGRKGALDACLASSIIEVGVDIDRLALMTVVGQPKTTSQYIQVSGRVGRTHPGLVVTIYGASKPRDRSHFERFQSYHERLYAEVEPTSVTPFALPVLDRALHAVTIAHLRQRHPNARPWPYPEREVEEALDILHARLQIVDPGEAAAFAEVRNRICDQWKRWQRDEWSADRPGGRSAEALMRPAGAPIPPDDEWRPVWEVPMSMRAVDSECRLAIIPQYDAERGEGTSR